MDSSDETMVFDYQTGSDETFSSDFSASDDDSTDDDMISITGELDRLSPAFCAKEGSKGKPITLTSSNEESTPTNDRKGQLFSDTSDESQGEDNHPILRTAGRKLDMPPSDDDVTLGEAKSDSDDFIPEAGAYNLRLNPDVFVFTGRAMDFNAPHMDADAAQRSFNHLYLEEQIARNVRKAQLEEDSEAGNSIYSHDPALVEVMSFLCPSYAASIQHALDSGYDEDAAGIFSYASNDDLENEAPVAPNVRRQLLPPDQGLTTYDYSLKDIKHSDLFVFDTGASNHGSIDDRGCIRVRQMTSNEVYSNNGAAMTIRKRYDRKGIVYNKHNEPVSTITMMGVNHTPSSSFNLFSVSHCLRKGWSLSGDFSGFTLTRDASKIVFDIRIQAGSAYLWTAKTAPVDVPERSKEVVNTVFEDKNENDGNKSPPSNKTSLDSAQQEKSEPDVTNSDTKPVVSARYTGRPICRGMTKEYAHVFFGHANVDTALATTKYLRFRMCTARVNCRQIVICEGCARGKARRIGVNIDGTSHHKKASAANLFIYLDISTIREAGGCKVRKGVWVGLVDEYSGMATSIFIASKGAMVETVCHLLFLKR